MPTSLPPQPQYWMRVFKVKGTLIKIGRHYLPFWLYETTVILVIAQGKHMYSPVMSWVSCFSSLTPLLKTLGKNAYLKAIFSEINEVTFVVHELKVISNKTHNFWKAKHNKLLTVGRGGVHRCYTTVWRPETELKPPTWLLIPVKKQQSGQEASGSAYLDSKNAMLASHTI